MANQPTHGYETNGRSSRVAVCVAAPVVIVPPAFGNLVVGFQSDPADVAWRRPPKRPIALWLWLVILLPGSCPAIESRDELLTLASTSLFFLVALTRAHGALLISSA